MPGAIRHCRCRPIGCFPDVASAAALIYSVLTRVLRSERRNILYVCTEEAVSPHTSNALATPTTITQPRKTPPRPTGFPNALQGEALQHTAGWLVSKQTRRTFRSGEKALIKPSCQSSTCGPQSCATGCKHDIQSFIVSGEQYGG